MAKFEKGKLSGTWSSDTDKGIWEGKKQAAVWLQVVRRDNLPEHDSCVMHV